MTLKDFIQKYNGKFVERYDSNAKNQCVDLFLAYLDEVLGHGSLIPIGINPAYDIYNKVHKWSPHSTKIKNTPQALPQYGDVIVWSSGFGPAGHVGIFLEGDLNKFTAFVQNDPVKSPSIIKEYTYTKVLGWLRPDNLPTENMTELQACLTAHKEAVESANKKEKQIKELKVELTACGANKVSAVKIISNLDKELNVLNNKSKQYLLERDRAVEVSKDYEKTISGQETEVLILTAQRVDLLEKAKQPIPYKRLYEEAVTEVQKLELLMTTNYVHKSKNEYAAKLQEFLIIFGAKN